MSHINQTTALRRPKVKYDSELEWLLVLTAAKRNCVGSSFSVKGEFVVLKNPVHVGVLPPEI
jgi:hypothetical protein